MQSKVERLSSAFIILGLTTAPLVKADEARLEEVIVTAQKRSESIQTVPMSITALTSQVLEDRDIKSFADYGTSIPNLSFGVGSGGAADGFAAARGIAIRGINGANTTGFYLDDTPIPDSIDPHVVDMQRIEVLRGPQGTLYGARSMGGTVRLISTPPDPNNFSAGAHVGLSETEHTNTPNTLADATVNLPLVHDHVALRMSGYYEYDAGYFKRASIAPPGTPAVAASSPTPFGVDNVGRSDTRGGSLALLWQVNDALSITPRVLYQRNSYNGFPFADFYYDPTGPAPALKPASFVQQRLFDVEEGGTDTWMLDSLTLKFHSDYGDLLSSTAYFKRDTDETEDASEFIYQTFTQPFGGAPLPAPVVENKRFRSYVEEVRFVSQLPGPVQFVAGAYFSNAYGNFNPGNYPPQIVPGLDAQSGGVLGSDLVTALYNHLQITEPALFGEVSWNVTDKLKLTSGARVYRTRTTSTTSVDGLANGGPALYRPTTLDEHGVNPKYEVDYQLATDHMVYGLVSKGFRPGGVEIPVSSSGQLSCVGDLQKIGLTPADTRSFKSDSLWNYELGSKNAWLGNRLVVNGAAYYIKWNNIQQDVLLPCGSPFTANAGAAKSEGAELEVQLRPLQGLQLSAGVGYEHAVITAQGSGAGAISPQVPGSPVYMVPDWTATASATYSVPLTGQYELVSNLSYSYVGNRRSANNDAFNPRLVPASGMLNANVGIGWKSYQVLLVAKNLTDTIAVYGDSRALSSELPGRPRLAISAPRTIGVELRGQF